MVTGTPRWTRRLAGWLALGLAALPTTGCSLLDMQPFESNSGPNMIAGQTVGVVGTVEGADFWEFLDWFKPAVPDAPAETLVLRPDGLVAAKEPIRGSYEAELAGAHEYYRREDYANAEGLFRRLGDNKKVPPMIAQEALFYQAESLRQMRNLPDAADTYIRLCTQFPQSPFRDLACAHAYDIANLWLTGTWAEMREAEEVTDGKRWFVTPRFISFERDVPFLDAEGRALEKLEQVRFADITGPLADKALFLAGKVKYYRGDYRDADHYFSQVFEKHPKSDLAPTAVEMAIISKNLSTGGSDYDGRKAAEARVLVHAALNNYPELAKDKQQFLVEKLRGIDAQQAESDFNTGEFYRRQGQPTSAYFYYELVVRRYPNTPYAQRAQAKMDEMRRRIEADGGPVLPRTPAADAAPARDEGPAVPVPQGLRP